MDKNKISLFDHKIKEIYQDRWGYELSIVCSCGELFDVYYDDGINKFNKHQKEELNKQLEEFDFETLRKLL